MSEQLVSIRDFLVARRLARKSDVFFVAETRKRLEQSGLLDLVDRTCAAFNREAGETVIEGHAYLPPEQMIRTFTFVKGRTEYVMRLDAWERHPALIFLVRKWHDAASNRFFRWIYRMIFREPLRVDVKLAGEIEEAVSENEVRRWFFYLLSGLSRSYTPPLKNAKFPQFE
jgi:hypothetical protein